MALIKCPECGKEVSNKALACIHCGYPLEAKKESTATYQEQNNSTTESENSKADKPVGTTQPNSENAGCLTTLVICGIIIVVASAFFIKVYGASSIGVILFFAFAVLFVGFFIHTWATADPKEVKQNWDKEKYNGYKFTCPMCGSHKVKKIGTMNRATSVAVAGLASSKIGKQYECDDCQHKW